jgi:transcriptional regulator with XRE-family HTH domain
MPRPSKHVSPDTLGGRIRAARKSLHLSLAEVANGHYSTSFISQIERNRTEPSPESLRFLADRLHLSLADLHTLAQQHKAINENNQQHLSYNDILLKGTQLLKDKASNQALSLLETVHFPDVPPTLRWRLVALRGHCYFAQRKFLKAEHDFIYALHEQQASTTPASYSHEELHDLLLLHLHLAATYRELQQFDDALEHHNQALHLVNRETPFGYVAEAHWGIALVLFTQASTLNDALSACEHQEKLHTALEHAESARFLYRSIGEDLQAAMVACQVARIQYALGDQESARSCLQEILAARSSMTSITISTTMTTAQQPPATMPTDRRIQQQREANVISAAACSLAAIELETGHHCEALHWAEQALAAGAYSYKLRRADAYLMKGKVLEAINPTDPAIEQALRCAIAELADTDRIAMRISVHAHLGRHLIKIGRITDGEHELERARLLSDMVSLHDAVSLED